MKKNMNIGILSTIIAIIMILISCSNTEVTKDPSLEVIFANNRVIESPLKSIDQTSTWSQGDEFGVYATESSLPTYTFMNHNTKVSYSNLNGWSYENPKYWPTETEKFTFFAYFPYAEENETDRPSLIEENGGKFNIEYSVNENVKIQEDLLWDWIINAYELRPSGDNTTVGNEKKTSFAFQHALSRVRFRVKANSPKTIYITSLTLTAYGNGRFTSISTDGSPDSPTTPQWETKGSLIKYNVVDEFTPIQDKPYGYVVDTEYKDLGFIITRRNDYDADYESFMIPQAKTEIKINLSYNIIDHNAIGESTTKTIEKEFTNTDFQHDWLLGHQYMYYIEINQQEANLVCLVGEWNDYKEVI